MLRKTATLSQRRTEPRSKELVLFSVVLALGLLLQFHPTFLNGFQVVQTDEGDPRFTHYLLEHEYRWLLAKAGHGSLWDPPIFYPEPNVLAYSDTLLSVAPFYWIFRFLELGEFRSFQFWTLLMACANFGAAYLFFSRGLKTSRLASLAAAFFFAFSAPRTNQLSHYQLQAHFFTPLFAYCVVKFLDEREARGGWYAVAAPVILSLQFYASYYLGWFLAFALLTGLLVGTLMPGVRSVLSKTLARRWRELLLGFFLFALFTAPLVSHYLSVAETLGYRRLEATIVATPPAWIYLGPESWLYSRTQNWELFSTWRSEHESRLGVGLLTSALILFGFWRQRKNRLGGWLIFTSLGLVVAFSSQAVWAWLHFLIPGAAALRVTSRIVLLLLLPAGFALAACIEGYPRPKGTGPGRLAGCLFVLLGVGVLLEQGVTTKSFDLERSRARVSAISSRISSDCPTFFVLPPDEKSTQQGNSSPVWVFQLDAMWASLSTGIPTVNGYSGLRPKGWQLHKEGPGSDEGLALWESRWPRLAGQVCQIPSVSLDATDD